MDGGPADPGVSLLIIGYWPKWRVLGLKQRWSDTYIIANLAVPFEVRAQAWEIDSRMYCALTLVTELIVGASAPGRGYDNPGRKPSNAERRLEDTDRIFLNM